MNVQIEIVRWEDAAALIKPIRETVFIHEQHVPPELEWDSEDSDATHVIALTTEHLPIATARLLSNGHIGRMAVLKAYRQQSIGSRMLTTLIDLSKQKNLGEIFLHAQLQAIPFYAAHGFTIDSDEFMDAGIPHRTMRLKL